MSRYLVDQLGTRSNIEVMFGTEVAAVHGESSLEAIEVRNSATDETSRLELGRAVHLHRSRRGDGVAAA